MVILVLPGNSSFPPPISLAVTAAAVPTRLSSVAPYVASFRPFEISAVAIESTAKQLDPGLPFNPHNRPRWFTELALISFLFSRIDRVEFDASLPAQSSHRPANGRRHDSSDRRFGARTISHLRLP